MERTYEQQVQDWIKYMEEIEEMPCPGIVPSPPDPRDYTIDDIPLTAARLPSFRSLPASPIILNQGQTPYCAGASGAGIANAFFNQTSQMPNAGFSMAFLYWLAKRYDGIPNTNGTYIRTILKIMKKYGCASENLAPYATSAIPITNKAVEEASKYKVKSYARLRNVYNIKEALNKGLYVLIGTLVTRGNWAREKGFLSYPIGDLYGGHGTFLFGYDDLLANEHTGYMFGQNSWGNRWGDNGRFYLPYDYFNMTHQGRNKFMEAWAVEFDPIVPEKEEEEKKDTVRPTPRFVRPEIKWWGRIKRRRAR